MGRRFLGLNFIQFVYIDYITCTFIILYGQEFFNHVGSNSIQGGNRKFLGCTQWSTIELEICWKYVLYEYRVTPSLLNSILSVRYLSVHSIYLSLLACINVQCCMLYWRIWAKIKKFVVICFYWPKGKVMLLKSCSNSFWWLP